MFDQLGWRISRQRDARAEADFTILEIQLEATLREPEVDSHQQLGTSSFSRWRGPARQKRKEQQVLVLRASDCHAIPPPIVASEPRVNHRPVAGLAVGPTLLVEKLSKRFDC